MAGSRLSRPNQTWALAYINAFANPLAPTTTELNNTALVHMFSCALSEEGTAMTLGDSDTDDSLTFCSIGNESSPTFKNPTVQWTGLKEANTGGSGSTADLTSLYSKLWAFVAFSDIPYYVISRTGPNASQDVPFVINHRIKMVGVTTDNAVDVYDQAGNSRIQQNFFYDGGPIAWNYKVAA